MTETAERISDDDCQVPCDDDCEIGPKHCWNRHRPKHKPGWHNPVECDERQAAKEWADEQAERIGKTWKSRPDREGLVTP